MTDRELFDMERSIADLKTRVESLEIRVLTQPKLGPPRNSVSPYDLGAIAKHHRRTTKNAK